MSVEDVDPVNVYFMVYFLNVFPVHGAFRANKMYHVHDVCIPKLHIVFVHNKKMLALKIITTNSQHHNGHVTALTLVPVTHAVIFM